jgi:AcrR family transcriptional regulator
LATSETSTRADGQRRNRGFEQTHRELIDVAVRLISERGADALSIAALARAAEINRTTVYYHFESRDALLAAVKEWSSEQIVRGMDIAAPRVERIGEISRFVLENPELIKLWIDDFLSAGDIRGSYPRWDELVAGIKRSFAERGEKVDAEVYCVMLLTAAIIGPHVFRNRVSPEAGAEAISDRFIAEQLRILARDKIG